jgi:hypothetical protein
VRSTTFLLIVVLLVLIRINAGAQPKSDSLQKKSITKRAFSQGLKLISTNPKDTIEAEKSINPYLQYTDKIIRNITIEKIGFEKSIYDSAKRVKKAVTKLANTLHVDTREKTVRQHLFFQANSLLNPYKLADNERFLRDRDFILDSRIVVLPVEGTDSVDVTVITRDVFSLGGTLGGSFPSAPEIGIYDANVDGRGQRVEFTSLIDNERDPKFGYSLLYRKSSLFGSLTNFDVQYTELNDGRSYGAETEYAFLIRLARPLVSPYSRIAGGLEVSQNWSKNVYNEADTAFLSYRYNIFDAWAGYNFGVHKEITNRNRKFLAFRYYDGTFIDQPEQPEYVEEKKFNSAVGYLTEFTFYRQNYLKTRYVFGFGRTEDIPYGVSLGVTGGYINELQLGRPYGAVKFNYGEATKKGNFARILFQAGGFSNKGKLEDIVVQTGGAYFTRLWQIDRYKMRTYVSATYTHLLNQTIANWLDVSKNEIPGFEIDSLEADQRLALHLESAIYTPWSLLGFRFAPFLAFDIVGIRCKSCEAQNDSFFGISSGFRTRNENLIFGSMELKITYIPENGDGSSTFNFSFKQNLRVKNSGNFVRPPSLIRYN